MPKFIGNNPAATQSNISPEVGYNEANKFHYIVNQILMDQNICLPCRIVTAASDMFGTYEVQPLVNILDTQGKDYEQPVISGVPYSQEIGGIAGFITEPQEGDTVLVVFAQRDITKIKKNWQAGNPDSLRKFALADAIIVKRLGNTPPSIYIKATADGIEIISPGQPVKVEAPEILLGEDAANNVLLQGVEMTVDIAGVQGGSGVTGVVMTVNTGGSSVVKALT